MACNVLVAWSNNALLFAALVLARYIHLALGNDTCTLTINIERNTQYSGSVGQSLSLRCPVTLCSGEAPNVTWCKYDGQACHPLDVDRRVTYKWTEKMDISAVHLLTFISVTETDSGNYQCATNYRGQESRGHLVKVNITVNGITVTDTPSMGNETSTAPTSISDSQMIMLIACVPVGALCLLIIIISLLVYCVRRRRAKSRARSKAETALKEISLDVDPESANILLQRENSVFGCGYNETETAPSETATENADMEPTTPDPVGEQESVVYADLNHSASRMINNISMDDDSRIEYATVNLKRNSSADG